MDLRSHGKKETAPHATTKKHGDTITEVADRAAKSREDIKKPRGEGRGGRGDQTTHDIEGELKQGLSAFRDGSEQKAQQYIFKRFPEKVLELTDFLKSNEVWQLDPQQELKELKDKLMMRGSGDASTDDPKKLEACIERQIGSNKVITTLLQRLKSELYELLEMVCVVKVWVQLNIPSMESGDTFGVEIQEEIIKELSSTESSAYDAYSDIQSYYGGRARIVRKIAKHHHIEDYWMQLIEADNAQYQDTKMNFVLLRDGYAVLLDLITKNIQKLRKPRDEKNVTTMF